MTRKKSFDEKRGEYYFTHLANMAFMGIADENNPKTFLVDKVNEKVNERLGKVPNKQPLHLFIKTIILDQEIIEEYLEIMTNLSEKENILSHNRQWRFFDVSAIHEGKPEEGIFIKSILPYGIRTGIRTFNGYKEAIYIDLFTATQIIDEKLVGIQGMMPIVNERRELGLLNQKSLELTLFHHLKVDMKKIPVMVDNLLRYDKSISADVAQGLNSIKDYSVSLTEQANNILTLFHKYVDITGGFPLTPITEIRAKAEILKTEFNSEVKFEYDFGSGLDFFSTTLFPDVFEFTVRQFVNNALKEYESKSTPKEKRKIKITVSKLSSPACLQITLYNSETTLTQPIIDNAGIRPVKSKSSGLGFYFLNYVLEMFRALKPQTEKPRFFELENVIGQEKGIRMDVYFPLISTSK
jgi:hypothetical protein